MIVKPNCEYIVVNKGHSVTDKASKASKTDGLNMQKRCVAVWTGRVL